MSSLARLSKSERINSRAVQLIIALRNAAVSIGCSWETVRLSNVGFDPAKELECVDLWSLRSCQEPAANGCAVDPGLLSVLEHHIVPRLKADVPGQPSDQELEADPRLIRFSIVFDREGYSPKFFARMKTERIAVLTYHKYPGEPWPEQEFRRHKVTLVNGEQVSMELAERGVRLSNDLWVREVRQRSVKGAQSSILSRTANYLNTDAVYRKPSLRAWFSPGRPSQGSVSLLFARFATELPFGGAAPGAQT